MPLLARMPTVDAVDLGEAAHQGGAVQRLELIEPGAVDQPRDELAHIVGLARARRNDAVQLGRIVQRFARRAPRAARARAALARRRQPHHARAQPRHGTARKRQRMRVVLGVVVGDAGTAAMHIGAAQGFGIDLLAGRRAHQRRTAQEHPALVAHDDGVIGHGRHVGAARGAGAVHHRDLRDALRRKPRLVEEYAAEVIAVGEHLVLPAAEMRRRSPPGKCRATRSRRRSPGRAGASSP